MHKKRYISLTNCLGLDKIDRFYYEDAPATPPAGTVPPKTETPANPAPNQGDVDISKMSDDEFAKFFEDPRAFNHPRFKQLADAKKERDALAKEKADREKADLEKQGEWEKLAKQRETELADANKKYENSLIDNAIIQAASQKGALDVEAVKALINRGNIKVEKDGTVSGIDEALETLSKAKTYLFDPANAQTRIGTPSNPSNPNNGSKRFTMSQIQDARFFREHEKEIQEAMRTGQIVDDRGQVQGPRR